MTGVLDMIAGSLGPTATYRRRDWVWVPAGYNPGDGRDGTLTLILQCSRRPGAKQEVDTYGVEMEEHDPFFIMGTSFLLASDTDDEQPDTYRVVIGPVDTCTCKAGKCRVPCKHIDAMRALLEEGVF